jgi:16S rRNA (guanine966-N2)-methyltransferase
MRIVGGRLRGRVLKTPASRDIRPTSDRLREALFDILAHAYGDPVAGARVIDLFAGSGALGFEALSRGASFTLFVDDGAEARALIRANIEAFALAASTRVWRADATKLGKASAQYSLTFLDPPYGRGLAAPALQALMNGGWLSPGALCAVEEDARATIDPPGALRLAEERTYGKTKIAIYAYETIEDRYTRRSDT